MKRRSAIALLATMSTVCATAGTLLAVTAAAGAEAPRAEVIVWTAPGASAGSVAESSGASYAGPVIASRGVHRISVPARSSTRKDLDAAARSLAARLGKDRRVEWVEPASAPLLADERFYAWPSGSPEPTTLESLQVQPAFASLRLESVHTLLTGRGTIVAVLDTGVDRSHPMLQGRLLGGYDMVDDDDDPSEIANGTDDDGDGHLDRAFGHGTFVAGIIGQIAPGASIVPVRVLDDEGRGLTAAVAEGIEYALESGATIINLSLGIAGKVGSGPVKRALQAARKQGVLVTAAAGNIGDRSPYFPAAEKNVISVTSLAASGTGLAPFSNRGKWVDLAAPGVGIVSAYPGSSYARWDGTSMAVAVVSAQIALIAEANARTLKDVEELLWKSSGNSPKIDTERGTIDLWRAASSATRVTGRAPPPEPGPPSEPAPPSDPAPPSEAAPASVPAPSHGIAFPPWTPEAAAAVTAVQDFTDAVVRHDWTRVRALAPGLATSDENYEALWGTIEAASLVPTAVVRRSSSLVVIAGVLSVDNSGSTRRSTLRCAQFHVDVLATDVRAITTFELRAAPSVVLIGAVAAELGGACTAPQDA